MRKVSDAERQAWVQARHHLGCTAATVTAATEAVVALHSSDPLTPYLALAVRVPGFEVEHLDDALCDARTHWRLHAMRRTLWLAECETAAEMLAATGYVGKAERKRVEKSLSDEIDGNVGRWLKTVEAEVLEHLRKVGEASTRELSDDLPVLGTELVMGSGKWSQRVKLSTRLQLLMAMDGKLVRTRTDGSWRASQYRWAVTEDWFGGVELPTAADAEKSLLTRYLDAFGPVTFTDIQWWTGWNKTVTRKALAAVPHQEVELSSGPGFMLPEAHVQYAEPVAALLPSLDPTAMGWKEREWYGVRDEVLDRSHNIGATIWWGGRLVGGWGQRPDGEVVTRTFEDLGAEADAAIDQAASRLQGWLGDHVVSPRFPAPLDRELARG